MRKVKEPFPKGISVKQDVLIDEIAFLKEDKLVLLESNANEATYRRISDKKSVSVSLDKIIEILGFSPSKIINCCHVTYDETLVGEIMIDAKIKVLKIGNYLEINLNSFEIMATSDVVESIKVTDNGKLIVGTKTSVFLIESDTK